MTRNLSIAERRKRFDNKHVIRSFRYIPKNPYIFGQQGKFVTIGCSRPPPPIIDQLPGPGEYDEESSTFYEQYPHKIQGKHYSSENCITQNCDFAPQPSSIPDRPLTIHTRTSSSFYRLSETPGPSFVPKSVTRPMTIGSRARSRTIADSPGPGAYDVFSCPNSNWRTVKMSSKSEREVFRKPPDTPPPGAYEIVKKVHKPGKWADRLRPAKDRHPSRPYTSLRESISQM